MSDTTPYIVPREPGRWRALTLAALVHAALLAFLWIGVHWQNDTPATIEAEVWSPQPREAAPLPEPDKTAEPESQPVVKEAPKPKLVESPIAKPDIALEQEKKRKAQEERKRLEEERLAKEKKQRLEEEKEKLAKLKQEELQKLEKEKAEKEKAEKKRKQNEADAKLLAKLREEENKRINGGLTGTGGSGDAPKTQGGRASAEYANRIGAKIKSNINFAPPESLQGNSPVQFEVRLLPDGSIAGIRKIRPSGVPGFDDAVERAILGSQPFPKDTNGTVPSSFIGTHKPKD